MRRVALLLLLSLPLFGQDLLTIGSEAAPSGGTVKVPVTLTDQNGFGIRGVAFKVLFDSSLVASAAFVRSGAAATITPLHETEIDGPGWSAYIVFFDDTPPSLLGTLNVTLQPGLGAGTVIPLRFDAPSVALSSATAAIESVANDTLTPINGSITVSAVAAPTGLVATATSASQVSIDWNDVPGVNHYQLLRSSGGGAFAVIASPSGSAATDSNVTADTTYLYRVRAIDDGQPSPLSNMDLATTIVFSTDTIVRALHITQLRAAVNAVRTAAELDALAADGTIAAGQPVRASHLTALRIGLNEARTALGLSAISYTDPTITAGATHIKATHVTQLRDGVR